MKYPNSGLGAFLDISTSIPIRLHTVSEKRNGNWDSHLVRLPKHSVKSEELLKKFLPFFRPSFSNES